MRHTCFLFLINISFFLQLKCLKFFTNNKFNQQQPSKLFLKKTPDSNDINNQKVKEDKKPLKTSSSTKGSSWVDSYEKAVEDSNAPRVVKQLLSPDLKSKLLLEIDNYKVGNYTFYISSSFPLVNPSPRTPTMDSFLYRILPTRNVLEVSLPGLLS